MELPEKYIVAFVRSTMFGLVCFGVLLFVLGEWERAEGVDGQNNIKFPSLIFHFVNHCYTPAGKVSEEFQ